MSSPLTAADIERLQEAAEWIVEGYLANEPITGPKIAHGIAELLTLLRPNRD
jgi:hypothetical protein